MATFKAVLVGAGGIGQNWGRTLKENPDVEIGGWVDVKPGAAAHAADTLALSGTHTGEDLGRALAEVKPDFVVDVTIPEAHHSVTLEALAAGVPVLGEKPMAASIPQAREMVAASEKADTLYMVSQSRRYDARLHAFRQLALGADRAARHSELGLLLGGTLWRISRRNGDRASFRHGDPHAGRRPVCVRHGPGFRIPQGVHPPWSWYKGASSATALFEMTGGLRYTYRGSWCSEGRDTSWEADWRCVGPRGTAIWDGSGANPPSAGVVRGMEGFIRESDVVEGMVRHDKPAGIAGSLQDFLNALQTGASPMGECHDNIKSLAMVFAAIESSAVGQRVRVEV